MHEHDSLLKSMRYKVYTIDDVRNSLEEALRKKPAAEENVRYLMNRRDYERKDVESFEKGNLISFVSGIFGKKEERLERERQEMYDAESEYNRSVYELNTIEIDISRYEREIEELTQMRKEYDSLIEEKKERLLLSSPELSGKILSAQSEKTSLEKNYNFYSAVSTEAEKTYTFAKELLDIMEDALYWANEVGNGKNSTWEEKDNRNNATFRAGEFAPKVKEQADFFREIISLTDISADLRFDETLFVFKDPDWEPFYGHLSLLEDIKHTHVCTLTYVRILEKVIAEINSRLSSAKEEYIYAMQTYEDIIINT